MDGTPYSLAQALRRDDATSVRTTEVVDFYEAASVDYMHWSRESNMHLGFYRRRMSLLDRDAMLEEFNLEIARRLRVDRDVPALLFDLGCGAGAVSRTVARWYPNATIKGVTISPTQVTIANEMNRRYGLDHRIEIVNGDYVGLYADDHSVDGVWAVESACYAKGPDKADLVREMARVLKPGGRFVIADCFLKRPESELNPFVRRCYRALCRNWALTELPVVGDLVSMMEKFGFRDLVVDDISWRTVPSLVHAPFVVSTFLARRLRARERLNQHSKSNLKASLIAPILGMNRSKFSYYMISGSAAS